MATWVGSLVDQQDLTGLIGCSAVLGLAEDLRNNMLSPRFRLFAELAIFSIAIAFWPLLIPIDFGLPGLDALMAVSAIG